MPNIESMTVVLPNPVLLKYTHITLECSCVFTLSVKASGASVKSYWSYIAPPYPVLLSYTLRTLKHSCLSILYYDPVQ